MQCHNPSQNMLQSFASIFRPEITNNSIEVFALDRSFLCANAAEGGRDGLQKPEDFLYGLSIVSPRQKAF